VAAVQIAAQAGLAVIGTASTGKKDLVEALGVTHSEPGDGVVSRVRGATPGGVDALRSFVTAAFPLERAPEALRLVDQGHARGKIGIEVAR